MNAKLTIEEKTTILWALRKQRENWEEVTKKAEGLLNIKTLFESEIAMVDRAEAKVKDLPLEEEQCTNTNAK